MHALLEHADIAVIVIYLAAMLWIGWRVTDGSRDVEGFTVGNRQMEGWTVGLSVLGTFLSSITFLGVPSLVYEQRNWNTFAFSLALPVAAVAAVLFFIPLYRRHVDLSAYELLEQRFGYWARCYAAISFVALQLIRVSMVLLLVALAIEPLLNWGVIPTLVVLGLVVIVYDVLGGIKAVIWTDVVQVFVLLGGALWCLGALVLQRPGGAAQFWADIPAGSFSMGTWASSDLAESTFLVLFLYSLTENLRNYGTDQNYVQRMLAARSQRAAAQSIWIGALSYLPISLIFCLIGTGLFVRYHIPTKSGALESAGVTDGTVASDSRANADVPLPAYAQPDHVFPHFIKHELSPLARGIVVAGILAAAMSTVDSCLNSMSMVILVDLVRRLRGRRRIPEIITLRIFTASTGILGTLGAVLVFMTKGEESGALMKLWWKYAGVAGAGLFGLFLLAWILPRLPSWGALVAVLSSIPVLLWGMLARSSPPSSAWSWTNCPLHPNLVGISGFLVLLLVGFIIWLFARRDAEHTPPLANYEHPGTEA
jgi:SSS family solute:Na+ symporter